MKNPGPHLRQNPLMATYLRLQSASGQEPRASVLSPARLRQLRERLDNGFYELPEVQAEVARRLRLDRDLEPSG